MLVDRRVMIVFLAALVALPAVATAQEAEEEADMPCDFNKDGRVGPEEQRTCSQQRPPPCDVNRDGRVDDVERRQCGSEGNATPPANGTRPPPPMNGTRPPPPMNGTRPPPPANGTAPQGERAAQGPSDDCRAALEDLRMREERFRAGIEERRGAFMREQERAAREFGAENHTEEEWSAFKAEAEERREAFEDELGESIRHFETEARGIVGKCEGQRSAQGNDCRPDQETFERFRNYVDEKEREFRADADARVARFEAYQEEQRANNETSEEDMRRARHLFEQEMQDATQRHRAAMERTWQEFNEKAARECLGGDEGAPREFKHIQQDQRGERLACGLEIQAKFDAFNEANGMDVANWTEEQREEHRALQDEARALREACEKRIHEEWSADAKAELRRANTSAGRFGSFEVEGDNGTGHVTGRFVAFDYEVGSLTLRDYSAQGMLVFSSFYAPHTVDEPHMRGAVMTIDGHKDESKLHVAVSDNPTGSFDVGCGRPEANDTDAAGHPDACVLVFDDATAIEPVDEEDEEQSRYRVENGERHGILQVRGPHAWDEQTLEFRGALRLFWPSENFVLEKVANKERAKIDAAIEQENVLAEITIALGEDDEPVAEFIALDDEPTEESGDEAVADPCEETGEDATTFELEGLKCGVVKPLEEGTGIDVVISAESDEPKTLVFNLAIDLFQIENGSELDADEVVVDYYDVGDDGEAEKVDITKADDITDVLDPSEDAPEYWIVLDEDGLQLLVSNSHFSTKRITVATEPEGATSGTDAAPGAPAGSDVPAPGALPLLAMLGAAALALRRRA